MLAHVELSRHDELALRLSIQVILATLSPQHLLHLKLESGGEEFGRAELIIHFATHLNRRGRSFAKVFGRLFDRYEEEILSKDNVHYAGEFFKKSPTLIEAALYYFSYRQRFGLTLHNLREVVARI